MAARIQGVEQGAGTPHDDQIEGSAHEIGQRLSRMIPSLRTGGVGAEQQQTVLTGEVVVPSAAIVEFDGGRIRTRKPDCRPPATG